jgi:Trk K+ transport system NAD-binding subunit
MRRPLLVLLIVYSIAAVGMTLIPDINNGPMSFFHAFYFVSYMGTTIGFGEIPHEFTDAQRMWVTISLYMTVIAWFYAITSLIKLLQDDTLQNVFIESSFAKTVKNIKEPFYIICGYGDTGTALVSALDERALRTIVIESNQDRLNHLILENYSVHIPALCADASKPENLQVGLNNKNCAGVVAITDDNIANLHIAISSKLLKPELTIIGRADSDKVADNMLAFGSDYVIDPFEIFAEKLHYALHASMLLTLRECLTRQKCFSSCDTLKPPKQGLWIVCSYGRFGKAVYEEFKTEKNIHIIVIEANPDQTGYPRGECIVGRGTEVETLQQAQIEDAVGIVVGTNDDVTNLSIIMLARKLNSSLFVVIRQNNAANQIIFDAAGADIVMQASNIIANYIRVLLTNPLLEDFLDFLTKSYDYQLVLELIKYLQNTLGDTIPITWQMSITAKESPALWEAIEKGQVINLGYLRKDPRDRDSRLAVVPLLLVRKNNKILLPKDDEILEQNDQILWCSKKGAATWMKWCWYDPLVLSYLLTGNMPPRTYFGRWLEKKFAYGFK